MKKFLLSSLALFSVMGALAQSSDTTSTRWNQYGQKVGSRSILSAEERDGILVFESKDQSYRFWLDNRVQIDGAFFWYNPDRNFNDIGNGVTFRRVRFAVKAQLWKKWYGEIDMNIANGTFELEDAYIKFSPWDFLNFKVGNFKENISMENTTSSRYLTFLERPMVISALVPSRHIGFQANYEHSYFLAQGGIFFQEVKDGALATDIVEENNKVYGENQGVSYAGRFVVMPFLQNDYGLHLGASVSYRTPMTDVKLGVFNSVRYSTRALSSINRKKYVDTDRILEVSDIMMQGYELAAFYGPFRIQGEYIQNNVRRYGGLSTNKFNGFYAFASMMLFGGKHQYDRGAGEFTQPSLGRKWGDMELALRYDYVDLNSHDVMGGSAQGITAGLNYYINTNVKVMINYTFVNNDRYANGKGDLYVGHDGSGTLTKDPSKVTEPKGKGGNTFNQMSMRIELDF